MHLSSKHFVVKVHEMSNEWDQPEMQFRFTGKTNAKVPVLNDISYVASKGGNVLAAGCDVSLNL